MVGRGDTGARHEGLGPGAVSLSPSLPLWGWGVNWSCPEDEPSSHFPAGLLGGGTLDSFTMAESYESNDQAGMSQPATQVTTCRCVRVDGILSGKTG